MYVRLIVRLGRWVMIVGGLSSFGKFLVTMLPLSNTITYDIPHIKDERYHIWRWENTAKQAYI